MRQPARHATPSVETMGDGVAQNEQVKNTTEEIGDANVVEVGGTAEKAVIDRWSDGLLSCF